MTGLPSAAVIVTASRVPLVTVTVTGWFGDRSAVPNAGDAVTADRRGCSCLVGGIAHHLCPATTVEVTAPRHAASTAKPATCHIS